MLGWIAEVSKPAASISSCIGLAMPLSMISRFAPDPSCIRSGASFVPTTCISFVCASSYIPWNEASTRTSDWESLNSCTKPSSSSALFPRIECQKVTMISSSGPRSALSDPQEDSAKPAAEAAAASEKVRRLMIWFSFDGLTGG